ncbi:MAG: hypothetical protein JXR73_00295 [Candidatus Omnitrophica bacterium]|nr:hypothetical protein [Candidatus Omnitrophota bacterium]
MANEPVLTRNDIATLIVSVAQIIGLIAIVAGSGPIVNVIAGIAGFAAVIKYFLPMPFHSEWMKKLNAIAAICGVGLIIFALTTI